MSRCLIIGCGCRGRSLAAELITRGHVVRGTTRDPGRTRVIEEVGAQPVVADPDRIATVAPALEHVAVVCVLLGSAQGKLDAVEALHGTRLDMLLTRVVDSPARGIVYETAGTVDAAVLAGAGARVQAFCEDSRIPYALLDADPGQPLAWLNTARAAVERVLR